MNFVLCDTPWKKSVLKQHFGRFRVTTQLHSLLRPQYLVGCQTWCLQCKSGELDAAGWWQWQKETLLCSHRPRLASVTSLCWGRSGPLPCPDPAPSAPLTPRTPYHKAKPAEFNKSVTYRNRNPGTFTLSVILDLLFWWLAKLHNV